MHDRVALVTGAARGIGREIARRLAKRGAHLVINDLPEAREGAEQLVEELRQSGRRAEFLAADVSDRDQMEALFAELKGRFGRLDMAVANAAWNQKTLFAETDWAVVQRILDVTLRGVIHVGQLASQQMMEQDLPTPTAEQTASRGKILMIGSIHGELAVPRHAAYATAKAAGNHFCRSLAVELIGHRINVNAINPGWIDTPGERAFLSEAEIQAAAKRLPWGRLGTPGEIAAVADFLLGPAGDYITGEVLTIDGGLRLGASACRKGLMTEFTEADAFRENWIWESTWRKGKRSRSTKRPGQP